MPASCYFFSRKVIMFFQKKNYVLLGSLSGVVLISVVLICWLCMTGEHDLDVVGDNPKRQDNGQGQASKPLLDVKGPASAPTEGSPARLALAEGWSVNFNAIVVPEMNPAPNVKILIGDYTVVTDQFGKAQYFDCNPEPKINIEVKFTHETLFSMGSPFRLVAESCDYTLLLFSGGLAVSGVVYDDKGEPAPNAAISLLALLDEENAGSPVFEESICSISRLGSSDERGHYACIIKGDIPPNSVISAVVNQSRSPFAQIPVTTNFFLSRELILDLKPQPGGDSRVLCIFKDGSPVEGLKLRVAEAKFAPWLKSKPSLTWGPMPKVDFGFFSTIIETGHDGYASIPNWQFGMPGLLEVFSYPDMLTSRGRALPVNASRGSVKPGVGVYYVPNPADELTLIFQFEPIEFFRISGSWDVHDHQRVRDLSRWRVKVGNSSPIFTLRPVSSEMSSSQFSYTFSLSGGMAKILGESPFYLVFEVKKNAIKTWGPYQFQVGFSISDLSLRGERLLIDELVFPN